MGYVCIVLLQRVKRPLFDLSSVFFMSSRVVEMSTFYGIQCHHSNQSKVEDETRCIMGYVCIVLLQRVNRPLFDLSSVFFMSSTKSSTCPCFIELNVTLQTNQKLKMRNGASWDMFVLSFCRGQKELSLTCHQCLFHVIYRVTETYFTCLFHKQLVVLL